MPTLPATDCHGSNRVMDGNGDGLAVVDMGADEVSPDTCPGDSDGNGDVDGSDLAAYTVVAGDVSLQEFAANFGKTECPE